jgi:hypothetical protein
MRRLSDQQLPGGDGQPHRRTHCRSPLDCVSLLSGHPPRHANPHILHHVVIWTFGVAVSCPAAERATSRALIQGHRYMIVGFPVLYAAAQAAAGEPRVSHHADALCRARCVPDRPRGRYPAGAPGQPGQPSSWDRLACRALVTSSHGDSAGSIPVTPPRHSRTNPRVTGQSRESFDCGSADKAAVGSADASSRNAMARLKVSPIM